MAFRVGENICALQCNKAYIVTFVTYAISEDAECWWDDICKKFEVESTAITWGLFQERFLEKYFPEDVRKKKEMEFLALTQGSMSVGEYAAKFEQLSCHHPHYHNVVDNSPNMSPSFPPITDVMSLSHFRLVGTWQKAREQVRKKLSYRSKVW